ncbi:MAG: UnbV protein [Ignavibacteria bacterium]|nr:UnbV protein [Ignavibacteria bacterium]
MNSKNFTKYSSFSIFALLLILFATHSNAQDKTWLTNITKESGLDSARGSRIWLADINGDNYPELLWGEGAIFKNHLHVFLNVENPDKTSPVKRIFVDFTNESGVNANRDSTKSSRIIDIAGLADFDNDSDLDLVSSIYYHRLTGYRDANDPGDRSEIMLNDGKGHFKLVLNSGLNDLVVVDTLPKGLINTSGISFLDYDFDGFTDIYFSTWFTDYSPQIGISSGMVNVLLKGKGDGTFQYIKNNGLQNISDPDYGTNVTDWNNDGWPDIITSPYCRSGGNLYKNMKTGVFSDRTGLTDYSAQALGGDFYYDATAKQWFQQALCQWSAQPADFDNDGDMDLLQVEVHGGLDPGAGRTHIAINTGPPDYKYVWEIERLRRDEPVESHLGDQGGTWMDIDGDGYLDVIIGQMAYPDANTKGQERVYFLRQNDSGYFDDISKALGFFNLKEGHTPMPCDYDLDGDVDLFVSRQVRDTSYRDTVINGNQTKVPVYKIYMQIVLLRNENVQKNNWTAVRVAALKGCNGNALGARISVYAGGMCQIREIQNGWGHFGGQQPYSQNFGLGKAESIDSIVIRYPMQGVPKKIIKNPPINQYLQIGIDGTLYAEDNVFQYEITRPDIFPNPAQDNLYISLPTEFRQNSTIEMFDAMGRNVLNYSITNTNIQHEIDISSLPSGLYFIVIKNSNGNVSNSSFVIAR